VVNEAAVAEKVAVEEPAAMVTDEGAVILPVVASVTDVAVGGATESVTVHVDAAPGARVEDVHVKAETLGTEMATAPPAAVVVTLLPSGVAATTPAKPNAALPDPETAAEIDAIVPFAIAVAFIPLATHV